MKRKIGSLLLLLVSSQNIIAETVFGELTLMDVWPLSGYYFEWLDLGTRSDSGERSSNQATHLLSILWNSHHSRTVSQNVMFVQIPFFFYPMLNNRISEAAKRTLTTLNFTKLRGSVPLIHL